LCLKKQFFPHEHKAGAALAAEVPQMAGLPKPLFPIESVVSAKAERKSLDRALDDLRARATRGAARDATTHDQIDGVQPSLVVEPVDEAELAQVLRFANSAALAVTPRGHGTKMGWGSAPRRSDVVLSTARLNRVLEHADQDMTVTVEAGATIGDLQRTLAQKGQRLALNPLWPDEATVGGVIATNDGGSLRIRFGGMRDLIIGITIVLPDGTIAMSGGKVVKNVAGYDLPKLMTGALGSLGIISKAVFRLHPLSEQSTTLTFSFENTKAANAFMLAIADSTMVPTGLQMRTSNGNENAHVDVRLEGVAAGVEAQTRQAFAIARTHDGIAAEHAATESQESNTRPGDISQNDIWQARELLWQECEHSLVLKLSTLPADLSAVAEFVSQHCSDKASWSLVAQSIGLAMLRVDLDHEPMQIDVAVEFLSQLRTQLAKRSGSAVVLHCPREIKPRIEVWGEPGGAQALMTRIKQKFDPARTLNPGRFVGGI
jgi:glycolate oxidase FAD binding subunit